VVARLLEPAQVGFDFCLVRLADGGDRVIGEAMPGQLPDIDRRCGGYAAEPFDEFDERRAPERGRIQKN